MVFIVGYVIATGSSCDDICNNHPDMYTGDKARYICTRCSMAVACAGVGGGWRIKNSLCGHQYDTGDGSPGGWHRQFLCHL